MTDDLEAAWDAVHDGQASGLVGRSAQLLPERRECQQYAFDSFEQPKVGVRSREWKGRRTLITHLPREVTVVGA